MLYIGPHVSAEEHLSLAPERAKAYSATGFALFTKNQKVWRGKALTDKEAEAFQESLKTFGYEPKAVLPHAGYLINPASPEEEIASKSLTLLKDELDRCIRLGLPALNIHPGAYKTGERREGIKRSASMLDSALEGREGVMIAIENTAGAGTIIGSSFDELEELYGYIKHQDQIGFTLDTAHLYGSGYDVRGDIDGILDDFFGRFGKKKLLGMHLNDSKVPLSSRKDRHESLGAGLIGIEPFRAIVRREEIDNIPLILETPDEERWSEEIRILKDEWESSQR